MASRKPVPTRKLYTEEDIKGILENALTLKGRHDFTEDDLVQMARQLDISPEQLAAAEAKWFGPHETDIAALRMEFLRERRRHHLGKLAGVFATMLFLGALIFFRTPLAGIAGIFLFITFFSAIGTIQAGVEALFNSGGEEFEEAFDRWLEQHEGRVLVHGGTSELPE